jgi:hypothetical protein
LIVIVLNISFTHREWNEKEVVFVTTVAQGDQTQTGPVIEKADGAASKPVFKEVVKVIAREANCSKTKAKRTIRWVEGYIDRARATDYAPQYPTEQQMTTIEYVVFGRIIGHDAVAAPGSAHHLIERLLLDPKRNEYSLLHTDLDDEELPSYCSIQVSVAVVTGLVSS